MSESTVAESSPSPPPIPKAAKTPSWLATLAVFCAIVCTHVGYFSFAEYYSGLTWNFPVSYVSWLGFFLVDIIVLLFWATKLNGGGLKTLALLASIILSFYLIIQVEREYRPFSRGLEEALHRTNLEPLRKWATAHRPPKSEFSTHIPVENSSIPEEVWRTIPYQGGRPYLAFHSSSEEDDWILVIDHSLCGFMYHHGFALTLGKDMDPSDRGPVLHARRVAPHLWAFPG
jgi:hypothetical protein